MTIAEQIKAGFAAAIAELKSTFGKDPKPEVAKAGETAPEPPKEGAITEEVMAVIKAELKSNLAPVQEQLAAANVKVKELEGQITSKDKEISDLKASAKTADELAAEKARQIAASQGISVTQLPAGSATGETNEQKIEALQKQLAAETDPVKKYELAAQSNKLIFGTK